jgi:ribonuclease BN (tRNA processing enzyme)
MPADAEATIQFLGSGDAFGDGGRFQACVLIEGGGLRLLLDCGATSLTAMKRGGVDPGAIDIVVVSHFHADHDGGLPLLILDGQFSRRDRPLAIVGPQGVERRTRQAMEVAFPGSPRVPQRFPVTFHELRASAPTRLGDLAIRPFRAQHTPGSAALMLRMTIGRLDIAYTGDTAWCDALPTLASNADLLICESYSWRKPIPYHLAYETVAAHRDELAARRLLLTHPGPEMLEHLRECQEEVAHDGLLTRLSENRITRQVNARHSP